MQRALNKNSMHKIIRDDKYGVQYDAAEQTELRFIPLRNASTIQITLYLLIYRALYDGFLDIKDGPWLIRYNANDGELGKLALERDHREVLWYLACRLDLKLCISTMSPEERLAAREDKEMTDERMMNRVKNILGTKKGGFWSYTFYQKLKTAGEYYEQSTQHSRETGRDEIMDLKIQLRDKIEEFSAEIADFKNTIQSQKTEIKELRKEVKELRCKNVENSDQPVWEIGRRP